ncbi:putative nucleotidyltransferase substrate binding domain-containing protein [Agarivorans aestuarii]|uniref:Nucleotidyltransferase substrate binding domain-containing protein n=1 Tax=Agarivorans aestuarii TaxID=1563703 RepID=A0ABU7G166_9ALTE|nr:putative nucleotidyltransferase substrate binding domain-containing protein [Agarivorans aestuarii]MEE1673073.1 putative nucleotidyltransferase substrate binding domain-containing protein [Agarivorans aestuarii]
MPQTLLPNIIEFLSQIYPFNLLPPNLQRQIGESVQITYLARGEKINFGNDKQECFLYIIRTGVMEQRKPDGVLRSKLGEEDLFGFTFLEPLKDALDGYSATAIENTLLYMVPHNQLTQLLEEHPEYADSFASKARVRLQSALNVVWSDNEKGLFFKKVSEVASGIVAVVNADMSIQAVAKEMREQCRSSTAVIKKNGVISGLITDRDMTKRVIAEGYDITRPISEVMTSPAITTKPNDLILTAASLMMEHNIRSLPVVENNQVLGLLTTSHLVQKHRVQAIFLIEKIKYTESIEGLAKLTPERQAIFEALVEGKVRVEVIGRVMAMIMDAYNRRLIQMAEQKLGKPPCTYTWVVAGSHARNEVHMLSDQDSAIILPENISKADRMYFTHLAMYVCNAMDSCGYPLCSGKFMAATPKWCQPINVWKEYYRKWVSNPEYSMLLNATVFMEVRCIHGDGSLSEQLQQYLYSLLNDNKTFLNSLVTDSVSVNPPLGIFNNLVLEKGGEHSEMLDIKKYALLLIVDLGRIYGLAVNSDDTGTEQRFNQAAKQSILSEDALKDVLGAYRFITQLRFRHQLKALKEGLQPDNYIAPKSFGNFEREHLKDAFRIIGNLQDAAKLRFSEK